VILKIKMALTHVIHRSMTMFSSHISFHLRDSFTSGLCSGLARFISLVSLAVGPI